MSDLSRRHFLKLGACVVGGACAASALPETGHAGDAVAASTLTTTLPYPRVKLVHLTDLKAGQELRLSYPDNASPISLLKFGKPVLTGMGPDQDIVAFSRYCTHMGGTLQFKADTGAFHCPLHYAMFDAQKGGLTVIGQATDNLPQVELEIDAKGDIYAVGIKGLIYGRQANVLA
ncbi:arsenate reductase (azurin) small subunit [Nitrospira lenta]|uniref:Arsenite oxidase subunit AioB n=1 Tax=Nitrospira lenta TaxID=1436998 RepID=A0A330LG61_9BACT|nr:arsenate reductase (azurin) small subunit [Nitrospira lenta]SPP66056.1 Arsenite oxidase subunit AioB [Nitrospira lenta]